MRLLDRHILKNFLLSYAACVAGFLLLYIVLDMTGKLDEFMKAQEGGTFAVAGKIASYYLYSLPVIFLNFSPLLTLAAAMFLLTRMIRHNEHVPIMASGVSLIRALMPVYWAAVGITGFIFFVQEIVIPKNAASIRDAGEVIQKNVRWVLKFAWQDEYNLILFAEYNIRDKTAKDCGFYQRNEQGKDLVFVQSKSAAWERVTLRDGTNTRAWVFKDCLVWEFDESGLACGQKFHLDRYEVPATATELRPELVRDNQGNVMHAATKDIYRKWSKEPGRVPLGVLFHSRLAFPMLNIVLLLLGIPFILMGDARNAFRGVGFCLLAGALLFLSVFICQDLGSKGSLSPVIAAWLPLALFGASGIILFDSIRT